MQADRLDQDLDLWLCAAEQDRASLPAKPPRHHREVEHQRRVREHELTQIDDHVGLCADRARQGLTPEALCASVFVASATKRRGLVIEVDDRDNLSKRTVG